MTAPDRDAGVSLVWTPRTEPLTPVALVAQGPVARQLARRLLLLDEARLTLLQGVCAEETLLLLGEETALPWIAGVSYLGREPAAPALLLPTTHAPSVPAALLERALLARFPQLEAPLAVLPGTQQVLSTRTAGPVNRELLRKWMGGDG